LRAGELAHRTKDAPEPRKLLRRDTRATTAQPRQVLSCLQPQVQTPQVEWRWPLVPHIRAASPCPFALHPSSNSSFTSTHTPFHQCPALHGLLWITACLPTAFTSSSLTRWLVRVRSVGPCAASRPSKGRVRLRVLPHLDLRPQAQKPAIAVASAYHLYHAAIIINHVSEQHRTDTCIALPRPATAFTEQLSCRFCCLLATSPHEFSVLCYVLPLSFAHICAGS
jgi:hypothetical protein